MTDRLTKIFTELGECEVFADIGCDHGYIAKAMLKSLKAKRVIISDISAKCLEKARVLLGEDIDNGVCESVVSNGFEKVNKCDLALIAGMGGEEIVSIIENAPFLPEKLVLQPMKNADKVRLCAVKAGYKVEKDFTFKSANKFYDLIILVKGFDSLTQDEIDFGRTNINEPSSAFLEMLNVKINGLNELLDCENLSEQSKKDIRLRLEKLKKYAKIN